MIEGKPLFSSPGGGAAGGQLTVSKEIFTVAVLEPSPVLDADLAELVIQCAPALVVVYDREGRILLFNPHCEQVTGY